MDCPVRARDGTPSALLDYCAHKLDGEASAALERHLEGCEACRDFVVSQSAVWSALDAWEAPPVSCDFDRRLEERIAREQRPAGWLALVWPWKQLNLRPALSLAAASVVALAVFLTHSPNPAPPAQRTQIESAEADHLERALDDLEMMRQLTATPAADSQAM